MSTDHNDQSRSQEKPTKAASSQLQGVKSIPQEQSAENILPPELIPLTELPLNPKEIVEKLEELVKFALECEKKELAEGVSFIKVYKELQELQKSIELLEEAQKENLELLQAIAQREGIQLSSEIEPTTEEDKKIAEKLRTLSDLCETAKERIHSEIIQNPDVQDLVTEKIKDATATDEKKQVRRKNKFKTIGGKQGWMPM